MKTGCYVTLTVIVIYLAPPLQADSTKENSAGVRSGVRSGEWGAWGEWSPCSRSCGMGVSARTRTCHLPLRSANRRSRSRDMRYYSSSSVRSNCVGLYKQFQVCNAQECPAGSTDFRQLQCEKFNDKPFGGGKTYRWKAFLNVKNKCELVCQAEKSRFYARLSRQVIDGTTCDQEDESYICVSGKCQVVVHVENQLEKEGLSFHWHGLYQRFSMFMDGVPYITQCPIVPGQSFVYRWKAEPAGTHWYHSHMNNQRLDGLYGLIVVHKAKPSGPYSLVKIQDWFWRDAMTMDVSDDTSGDIFASKSTKGYSVDGIETDGLEFDSILINGRGRWKSSEEYPLTTFDVAGGGKHRFHIVNSGADFSLELSIDQHTLRVIATEVGDLDPVTVDMIILGVGERIVFEIDTNQNPTEAYWMRVKTLRWGGYGDLNDPRPRPVPDGIVHQALAIIAYGSSNGNQPRSSLRTCTEHSKCIIFNCPYGGYGRADHRTCISIGDATSPDKQGSTYGNQNPDDVEEYFLNFGFNGGRPAINAKSFVLPGVPVYDSTFNDRIVSCDTTQCQDPNQGCQCTQKLIIPYNNKIIQIVLTNYPNTNELNDIGLAHHPVHIHGHRFGVVKIGFPSYDPETGLWVKANPDIQCGGKLCKNPSWSGKQPALNLENPAWKDTVFVPARGYAVLRLKANNPGAWFMHCHIDLHLLGGMALIVWEGQWKGPPEQMLRSSSCTNYNISQSSFQQWKKESEEFADGVGLSSGEVAGIVIGCILVMVLIAVMVILLCKKCSKSTIHDHPPQGAM